MFKRLVLSGLFCVISICATADAQDLCPTGVASDKLVCVIPQVFGINGIQVTRACFKTGYNRLN